VKDHRLIPHIYADDKLILGICSLSETDMLLQNRVSDCNDAVSLRMAANHFQLKQDKMEAAYLV